MAVPVGAEEARRVKLRCDRAVTIDIRDHAQAVLGEYLWLQRNFPGHKVLVQALLQTGGRSIDVLTVKQADGRQTTVCFDISAAMDAREDLGTAGGASNPGSAKPGCTTATPVKGGIVPPEPLMAKRRWLSEAHPGHRYLGASLKRDGRFYFAAIEIEGSGGGREEICVDVTGYVDPAGTGKSPAQTKPVHAGSRSEPDCAAAVVEPSGFIPREPLMAKRRWLSEAYPGHRYRGPI